MIGPGPHNKTRQSNQCGYCTYYLDNFFWSVKMVKLVRLLRPGWLGWSVSCQGIGVVSWWYGLIIRIIWYIADSTQAEYCTTFHSVCPSTRPDHSEGESLVQAHAQGGVATILRNGPDQARSDLRTESTKKSLVIFRHDKYLTSWSSEWCPHTGWENAHQEFTLYSH